jgi:hypothetical protein
MLFEVLSQPKVVGHISGQDGGHDELAQPPLALGIQVTLRGVHMLRSISSGRHLW